MRKGVVFISSVPSRRLNKAQQHFDSCVAKMYLRFIYGDCYRKPSLTLFVFCFLLLLFSVIIALSSFVILVIVLVCYVTFHCTFLFRFTVISAFSRSIRSERTVFPCSVLDFSSGPIFPLFPSYS